MEVFGKRFANLPSLIESIIKDHRKPQGQQYSVVDIVGSVVSMFLTGQQSRNNYNTDRVLLRDNFCKGLGINLCHGDTSEDFLRVLNPEQSTILLQEMVRKLIADKVLDSFRYQGYFPLAIDGVTLHGLPDDHKGTALYKESKNGVKTYYSAMLEAKLVSSNDFAISLAQEPISNDPLCDNEKQDCEIRAFERLAVNLKAAFPRLPIILLLDALYFNERVISICEHNGWKYIIVQKDNAPAFLREEIELRPDGQHITKGIQQWKLLHDLPCYHRNLRWFSHKNHLSTFAWCTNLEVSKENLTEVSTCARLRWKIENQGFDVQKNHGYNLSHRYSRISTRATANYYIFLQIAHLFNQLVLLEVRFKNAIQKLSKARLWEHFRALLRTNLHRFSLLRALCSRKQHSYTLLK